MYIQVDTTAFLALATMLVVLPIQIIIARLQTNKQKIVMVRLCLLFIYQDMP